MKWQRYAAEQGNNELVDKTEELQGLGKYLKDCREEIIQKVDLITLGSTPKLFMYISDPT